MTEQTSTPSTSGDSYQMGDVGAGANVQQGKNQFMQVTNLARTPGNEELIKRFEALLQQIAAAPGLDEDTRELSIGKTKAVAESLSKVQESPNQFKRVLLDAKAWLSNSVNWAWDELSNILQSEVAQKTIGTITEASVKGTIQTLIGR